MLVSRGRSRPSATDTPALSELPQALESTSKVSSQTIDATGWSKLAEIAED
jgi:hypothetical protein